MHKKWEELGRSFALGPLYRLIKLHFQAVSCLVVIQAFFSVDIMTCWENTGMIDNTVAIASHEVRPCQSCGVIYFNGRKTLLILLGLPVLFLQWKVKMSAVRNSHKVVQNFSFNWWLSSYLGYISSSSVESSVMFISILAQKIPKMGLSCHLWREWQRVDLKY